MYRLYAVLKVHVKNDSITENVIEFFCCSEISSLHTGEKLYLCILPCLIEILHNIERDPKNQAFFGVVQVHICDFLDPFQTIEQGASVYKQKFGGLKHIALLLQKYFQRMVKVGMIFPVILPERQQFGGAEQFRGEDLSALLEQKFQQIIFKTVVPVHAVAAPSQFQYGLGLLVSLRQLEEISDLGACAHFQQFFPKKHGEAAQDVRRLGAGMGQIDDDSDPILMEKRIAVLDLRLNIA